MDRQAIIGEISQVIASQRLAVLATNEQGQPYSCLVAIAGTADLKYLLFSTSRHTRKYEDITKDRRVSILLDNRANDVSDFNNAVAVTAMGTAGEVMSSDRESLLSIYLEKHPLLKDFAQSEENALICVSVNEYIISSFRSVRKLQMD